MSVSVLQALILGIIQGITEFLPVSSSGHLVILQNWMNIDQATLTFDVMVHVGSLLAVVIALFDQWMVVLKGLSFKPQHAAGRRLLLLLIVASIPAGVIGLTVRDWVEAAFSQPVVPGIMLLVTGGLLSFADRAANAGIGLEGISLKQAFIMGVGQALALLPGLSRSGTTMSFGLFSGMKRADAAKFSFLMAVPAILGAALLEAVQLFKDQTAVIQADVAVVGILASAVSSFLAIKLFLKFLQRGRLRWFSYYLWVLGVIVLYVTAKG
jgi:undecaprenyl-diphosphatase